MKIEKENESLIIEKSLNLITLFEGFVNQVYLDVVAHPTIGYGTTNPEVLKQYDGKTITKREAKDIAKADITKILGYIEQYVTADLNVGQIAALVDFIYNVGIGRFRTSGLLIAINENAPIEEVIQNFIKYRFATINGVHVRYLGLERRRLAECEMYVTGDISRGWGSRPQDKVNKYVASIEANELPW